MHWKKKRCEELSYDKVQFKTSMYALKDKETRSFQEFRITLQLAHMNQKASQAPQHIQVQEHSSQSST